MDDGVAMSRVAATCACLLALAAAPLALAASSRASWAQPEIRMVTAHGLMGGDERAFRADDPLTQGELADLVAGLTETTAASVPDPAAPVTIARLDAALVRAVGLRAAAREFAGQVRAAGLQPPSRFGTEVVTRLLGLRPDHPRAEEALEPAPTDEATRAEAAFSTAKILRWQGWERDSVENLAAAFSLAPVEGLEAGALQEAISLVGYPYVWSGASEKPHAPLGTPLPGGFDCSGFVWRVFKTSSFAVEAGLADTLHGRSSEDMAAETPRGTRIRFASLEPADIVFFGPRGPRSKPAEIDHVGIYVGGGWMIHASNTGVSLSPLDAGSHRSRFAWGRRLLDEIGR